MSFIRDSEGDNRLVLHNVSDVEVTVSLNDALADYDLIEFTSSTQAKITADGLKLPAYSSVVLK